MRIHIFIVLLCASCMQLTPVDASGLTERFWFLNPSNIMGAFSSRNNAGSRGTASGVNTRSFNPVDSFPQSRASVDGPLAFSPGKILPGMSFNTNHGSVFAVRLIQYHGSNGECEEEVTIGALVKGVVSAGKIIYLKCLPSRNIREIRNENQVVLIGDPKERFCVFTTSKREIYYLQDGKWKKGEFGVDEKTDQYLSTGDASKVNERITKWKQFFDTIDTTVNNIKGLKKAEENKSSNQKKRLEGLIEQERDKYYKTRDQIIQLQDEEINRYTSEINQIYANQEGWSPGTDEILTSAESKYDLKIADLDRRKTEEENKYKDTCKKYETQIDEESKRCNREIDRLNNLQKGEEDKAISKIKQNIQQGW